MSPSLCDLRLLSETQDDSHRCFLHISAFLNARLRWEVCWFLVKLMMWAFSLFEPFHRAVVEAWCFEEQTRHYSDLFWWAVEDQTHFALRERSNAHPFGVPVPKVQRTCSCLPADSGKWPFKGWLIRDLTVIWAQPSYSTYSTAPAAITIWR